MKTYIVAFIVAICTVSMYGQSQTDQVQVGTVYQIGKPTTNGYEHIHFPRPNIIIKRGGIANYKSVKGHMVVMTMIKEKKDGSTVAKIKRKDGGRFFGSHRVIEVDLKDALASGELISN